MKFLTKVFGTKNDKIIRGLRPLIQRINDLEATLEPLSDADLAAKTQEFRQRSDNGESETSLLPEAFAVCREGGRRALGQRHYDVQLVGGIVLNQGKIAEMKTGEGKTLTATLPVYLHGLTGRGAHVVTVNDYLAKRDAEWMGQVYRFLGLSVGSIVHGLSDRERKESYGSDITYGTNNEFGFDYLRDNMKTDPSRLVQRGHNFAIVDEVDSILIDEARTPLIISGPTETSTELYQRVNGAIPGLQRDSDYTVDEKARSVALTEDGITKLERRLKIDNIYDPRHIEWLHHIQQALKAHVVFKKDVDYVVRDGEIIIVDEFTGRLMPGRRYSDGLHGALEAKEHVPVQQETQTLASITFQNYFRLYKTLSGMTGTADTEAVEFKKIYNLDVVVIPTNRPMVRADEEDVIYRTVREKFEAIADEIEEATGAGQPCLVGTVSVEKSELLSSLLRKKQIPHDVLNAKHHAHEAGIISKAGHKGHVTIATNMAGRGTDIVLGEGVKEAGGLYVIATERHESRRIDNQLRGRSGRQGDPGKSKFFLSLEDDLMRIFASDRLSAIMSRLGMEEGEAIVSPMVTRAIEKAQRRVEEQNFSYRKNLIEYDDVMNQQRQVVYQRRHDALITQESLDFIGDTIQEIAVRAVVKFSPENMDAEGWDVGQICDELKPEFNVALDPEPLRGETSNEGVAALIAEQVIAHYRGKFEAIADEDRRKIENFIYLQVIDQAWKDHLLAMDALKDSVSLRGYAQRDPLQEYKREAFTLFSSAMARVEEETALSLIRMPAPAAAAAEWDQAEQEEFDGFDFGHGEGPPDNMIYGSPESAAPESRALPQTYRRDGDKVGRNSPCPCGSGKKFKKCHGQSGAGAAL